MDRREEENPYERPWLPPFPSEEQMPDTGGWAGRSRAGPHPQIQDEAETRRLLAEQVYRVPEGLLDDVIRVRMADLDR